MRSHFFFMLLFALCSSVVIALVTKSDPREQWRYFWKFFGALMLIGLILAWIMYPFPIH